MSSAAQSAQVSDRLGLARMLKARLSALSGHLVHLGDSSSLLSTGEDLLDALRSHSAEDGVQSLGQLNAAARDLIARLNRHLADLDNFAEVSAIATQYKLTKTLIATQNIAPTFWRLESPELPVAIVSKSSVDLATKLAEYLQAQRQGHDEALSKLDRLVTTLEYAIDTFSQERRQTWAPTMAKLSEDLTRAQLTPDLQVSWIEQNVDQGMHLLSELGKTNPVLVALTDRMWLLDFYGSDILLDSAHKENWCDEVTRLEDDLRATSDPDRPTLKRLNERAIKLIDVYEQFFATVPAPAPVLKKASTSGESVAAGRGDDFTAYQGDNPFGALPTARFRTKASKFSTALRALDRPEDSGLASSGVQDRLNAVAEDANAAKRQLAASTKPSFLKRRIAAYVGSGIAYVGGLGTLWMASPTVGTAAGMALVSGTVGALAWSKRRTVRGEVISSGEPIALDSVQALADPAPVSAAPAYPEQDADLSDEQTIKVNGIREHIEELTEHTTPSALLAEQLRLSGQRLSETVTAFTSLHLSTDSRRVQAAAEFSTQLDLIAKEVHRLAEAIDDEALRTQSAHGSYLRDAFGVSELNLEKTDE